MIQLREKLSNNGLLALRGLHDCRVISAHWTNPGYEELHLAGLVSHRARSAGMNLYRLNHIGQNLADRKFGQ